MKRKIAFAFALVSFAAAGGALSCITWGQVPFGPTRVARPSSSGTYSSSGGETITVLGADIGPNFEDNVASLAGQLKSAEGAEKESVLAKLKSEVGNSGTLPDTSAHNAGKPRTGIGGVDKCG